MTNREIGEMIRTRRESRGMTQAQLAGAINMSESAIAMYEAGKRRPKDSTVEALADVFNVPKWAILYREDEMIPEPAPFPSNVRPITALHHQRVQMIGEIAAGEPISREDVSVYVDSPVECDAAITVHGDSMAPNYIDGDIVYIKCVDDVPEGAVAVVFLDNEGLIKHVYKRPKGLTLWSDNPEYMPMQIEYEDYSRVRIFGIPVGFTRMYKSDITRKIKKGFH